MKLFYRNTSLWALFIGFALSETIFYPHEVLFVAFMRKFYLIGVFIGLRWWLTTQILTLKNEIGDVLSSETVLSRLELQNVAIDIITALSSIFIVIQSLLQNFSPFVKNLILVIQDLYSQIASKTIVSTESASIAITGLLVLNFDIVGWLVDFMGFGWWILRCLMVSVIVDD